MFNVDMAVYNVLTLDVHLGIGIVLAPSISARIHKRTEYQLEYDADLNPNVGHVRRYSIFTATFTCEIIAAPPRDAALSMSTTRCRCLMVS